MAMVVDKRLWGIGAGDHLTLELRIERSVDTNVIEILNKVGKLRGKEVGNFVLIFLSLHFLSQYIM